MAGPSAKLLLRLGALPQALLISSNTANYNAFVAAGSPVAPVNLSITIGSGVVVYSSNSNPAMLVAGFAAGSKITINNLGYIVGDSGGGGIPGSGSGSNGSNGGNGHDALEIDCDVTIDNTYGGIYGGGGGGGGGGGAADRSGSLSGGSGGRGSGANSSGLFNKNLGNAGEYGTTSKGGKGGDGGAYGNQGEGGKSGVNVAGAPLSSGGSKGSGGKSIRLASIGNVITWLGGYNSTQVRGGIST